MSRILDIPLPEPAEVVKSDGNRSTIEIAGLYPGYGITLGNVLRRVLLSSLPGAAATSVTFMGVAHEFTTVPGVKESVLDIVLNLKRLRLKLFSDEPQRITLARKGEGMATAKDLVAPAQVQIVSTDLPIATLTAKKAELNLEIAVERGIGYVPAAERKQEKMPVGSVALDAIFTPVREVNFTVENMRVGDKTDYNRLRLDIETDGTTAPEEALAQAASILVAQFGVLVPAGFSSAGRASGSGTLLSEPLAVLGLTGSAVSKLEDAKIRTVGELISKTEKEIAAVKGLGAKALADVMKGLKAHNLELVDRADEAKS